MYDRIQLHYRVMWSVKREYVFVLFRSWRQRCISYASLKKHNRESCCDLTTRNGWPVLRRLFLFLVDPRRIIATPVSIGAFITCLYLQECSRLSSRTLWWKLHAKAICELGCELTDRRWQNPMTVVVMIVVSVLFSSRICFSRSSGFFEPERSATTMASLQVVGFQSGHFEASDMLLSSLPSLDFSFDLCNKLAILLKRHSVCNSERRPEDSLIKSSLFGTLVVGTSLGLFWLARSYCRAKKASP